MLELIIIVVFKQVNFFASGPTEDNVAVLDY